MSNDNTSGATVTDEANESSERASNDAVDRVLANEGVRAGVTTFGGAPTQQAQALQTNDDYLDDRDGDQFDREDRQALRRVGGLSTELEDVTEVEYRQLRLEQVVLIGIYTQGNVNDAENSLRELSALAETAGATVLETPSMKC